MRPLYSSPSLAPEAVLALRKDVVPAVLHDNSGKVFDDKLYTLYTTSSNAQDNEISVSIIARDLVEHTAANGVLGYWSGIGINSELVDAANEIYTGWGEWDEERNPLLVTQPNGEQTVGADTYATFYWNSASAAKHNYKGYVVLCKHLDTSRPDSPEEIYLGKSENYDNL